MVPTAFFKLLYGLVILGHERRRLIGFGVTTHPTAEWIARQVPEAFPRGRSATLPAPLPRRGIRSSILLRFRAMRIRDRHHYPRV